MLQARSADANSSSTTSTSVAARATTALPLLQAQLKAAQENISITFEIITPMRAKQELDEHNNCNRPLSEATARKYASRMGLLKWVVDGQTIVYDYDGELVNGQQRFKGCVLSQTPFVALVVRGVHPDARDTTDDFRPRNATDTMQRIGLHLPRPTATAAQVVIRYLDGGARFSQKVSNAVVVEFVRANPTFAGWVTQGHQGAKRSGIYKSIPLAVAVSFLASHKYPLQAATFLSAFASGANLPQRSPVLALRNRFEGDKRMRSHERVAAVVQAWNAYIEGRSMTKIQLYKGDKFPVIKGAKAAAK